MGEKIKQGMLCSFVMRKRSAWVGDKSLPDPKKKRSVWDTEPPVVFSSPLVTVLRKSSGKFANVWTSYCLVIGVDKAKQSIKAWVLAEALKPVKNPSKANLETCKC